MKKLTVLIIILTLMLSLASCSGTGTGSTKTDGNKSGIDFAAIMSGQGTNQKLFDMSSEEKAALVSEAKNSGYDVTFQPNGETRIEGEGTVMLQKADGSWVMEDENGAQGQFGGDWPENEFTKLVPKPEFSLVAAAADETQFSVMFLNVKVEDIRAYVEEVKAAGFTVDPVTADEGTTGITMFSYSAGNAGGYKVDITLMAVTSSLTITKAE